MTELCPYCQAIDNGGPARCDNYPNRGFCPVDWKPEPEFCCNCGTDITGSNMPQCDACSEKEAAKALRIGGLVTMLYRAGRRA